jgi:hypothetical protein
MPSLQPPPRPPATRLSSPSMRHLKARLQVLQRPMVWGSAAVLLAAGYFLSSYWSSLTGLTQSSSQTPSNSRQNPLYRPQATDPGSASGFGNLPGFSDPMGQSGIPGLTPVPSATSRQPSSINPFAASSPQGGISPVPSSPDSGLPNGTSPASSYSSGGFDAFGVGNPSGAGSTDPTQGSRMLGSDRASTSESAPVNPLQSALDRATHSTSSPSSGSTSAAQPSDSLPSATPSAISGTLPGSSAVPGSSSSTAPDAMPLSPVGQSGFQPYVPRTSPPPGTTGYTVPPAFRTPASSSSSGFSNFSRPQPLPGDYSAPVNPPYATQPMLPNSSSSGYGSGSYTAPAGTQPAQSFSVPRSAPGQAIGGGQINTFSNP